MRAKLADGRVLEFPDGTDPKIIQSTVKRILNVPRETEGFVPTYDALQSEPASFEQRQAKKLSPLEAGIVSTGRGFKNIAEAVGLAETDPSEKAIFGAVEEEFPIASEVGQAVGETAPFLLPGTALGAIPKLAPRVAAATGLGLSEGAIISKGRGGDDEQQLVSAGIGGVITGGAEVLFPVIGRLGGALFRKVMGKPPKGALLDATGNPTPEFNEALDSAGVTFEDITVKAKESIEATPGADPEQAARLARLESLGAPATKGDITGEFSQQAAEAQLVESAADPLGDKLRTLRLEQSRAFATQLDEQIQKLGVPENTGASLKEAISGQKKLLTKEKNALYKEIADTSPEIANIPILTDAISEAIPDAKTARRLSRISGNDMGALDDLLIEFGINKAPDKVKAFLDGDGAIEQLSVGNIEEFRQALNQLGDNATSGGKATLVATSRIKNALDAEADLIDSAIKGSGLSDTGFVSILEEARSKVRTIKTEFSKDAISGRLIAVKRDGITPVIESSKAYKELMGTGKAPELLERTLETLNKSGSKGKRAIGDLQAATLMDLMDSAFGAQTRKIGGEKVFGGVAFNKKLEQIGTRKLDALFKNQPAALRRIKTLSKAAEDLTPPSGAVPKGSANIILDSLNRLGVMAIMGKVPGGALFVETVRTIADKGANRKVLETALNAKPNVKRMASFIADDLPGLASPLGVSFLATNKESDQ